jgi:uncharacterized protein with GYD domain
MAKFMVKASYNADSVKGIVKEGGTGRVKVITAMIEGMGGTLEGFYFAFGDTDVYVIVDLPGGTVDAAAVAAAVGSSGAMSKYETVTLLTPEEVDVAVKKAVDFRPPGS